MVVVSWQAVGLEASWDYEASDPRSLDCKDVRNGLEELCLRKINRWRTGVGPESLGR